MNKHTGFLLSYLKYGDNDAVLHCFTKEAGFQSFFLRGVYSAKNKKKAYLMPLNELSLTINSSQSNAKLQSISKIDAVGNNDLYLEVKQNAVIFFIADFLNQTLKSEQENLELFNEIKRLKENLYKGNLYAHYAFLIKILNIFGLAPLVSESSFLNIEKGIFEDGFSSQNLDQDLSEIWKKILIGDVGYELKLEKTHRKILMDSILIYYKNHFPEFYTPKSLQVIHQLFE